MTPPLAPAPHVPVQPDSPRDGRVTGLPPDLRVFDRGWLSSTSTLCLGDAPTLIDTGHVKHAALATTLVREALGQQPLAQIAHTHLHSDHCGGTSALQRLWSQATTWVPQVSLATVQAWDEKRLGFDRISQRCDRFRADAALQPGRSARLGTRDWQVHAAPGHDALAVLLLDTRDGVLIAGDALWEQGVGIIFPEIDGSDTFARFAQTLDLIDSLQPEWVVPGHGPAFSRASGRLAQAMAQARHRIGQFAADPRRHALYAAKVMIRYQMLDAEAMPLPAFHAWLDRAPILRQLHHRFWPDTAWEQWLDGVLEQMLQRGALRLDAGTMHNGPA